MSTTANSTDAVASPVKFLAVTIYGLRVEITVGVPVITPVVVLKVNPKGKLGEILKLLIGPPVELVLTDVMVVKEVN